MKNMHYIGMKLRTYCAYCGRPFKTQIIDKMGNFKNNSCAKCKKNKKCQIENGVISENDIFIPDWDEQ